MVRKAFFAAFIIDEDRYTPEPGLQLIHKRLPLVVQNAIFSDILATLSATFAVSK